MHKTYKNYQRIIKELIEKNNKNEARIESLLSEIETLKEKNKKESDKLKESSFLFNEENESSRNILIKDGDLSFRKFIPNFFRLYPQKIANEEVEEEKLQATNFLCSNKFNWNEKSERITKKRLEYQLNLQRITRKSIVLGNQFEFNPENDFLDFLNLNVCLLNNRLNLNFKDFLMVRWTT